MGNTFSVSTSSLATSSGDVLAISADLEAQVEAMTARLTALQDEWTGAASSRFQDVLVQWRGTQRQVKESLDAIGAALSQAGEAYDSAEMAAQSALAGRG